MSEPHTNSDDMAIEAGQARIWDNLTVNARRLFERACTDPSVCNLQAVQRVLTTMHMHHYARLLAANKITMMAPAYPAPTNPHTNPVPLTVHVSKTGRIT